MVALGSKAPDFNLKDVASGKTIHLGIIRSEKATVIMFICNHCPFVKHIQKDLVKLVREYQPRGVVFIGINSNDMQNYPEDSPEKMARIARQFKYPFPYLFDETQQVAKAYNAACTPDFFVYDAELNLVYRGQMDDSRPGNDKPVTGRDLRETLDNILAGLPVNPLQKPSMGCNIKWKAQS
jgi:peroxiredoxin